MSQLKHPSDSCCFFDWRKRAANTLCAFISFATFLSGCDVESNQNTAAGSEESIEMAKPHETTSSPNAQSSSTSVAGTFLETIAAENELFRWSLEIESARSNGLYVANARDFKKPYSNDAVNKKKQNWKSYSEWIPKFYDGYLFSAGWTSNANEKIGNLNSESINQYFNVIGRVVAAEWAKDNSVRRISTNDLSAFAKILSATKSEKELIEQLKVLSKEVQRKLETQ